MTASEEIIRAAYAAANPVTTNENNGESAIKLTRSDQALRELVKVKCQQVVRWSGENEETVAFSEPAIDIIVRNLKGETIPSGIPEGIEFEFPLWRALYDSDDELLARCWNEMMVEGGWKMVQDGVFEPDYEEQRGEKPGWMMRGVERISTQVVIDNLLIYYVAIIDLWIARFTKTLYLNTTTKEWAQAFGVDMSKKKKVKKMTSDLLYVLMGE